MEDERTIGTFDPSILEHFKFEAFTWWHGVLFVLAASALIGYLLFGVYLSNLANRRQRRVKKQQQVQRWLDALQLNEGELKDLHHLAGSSDLMGSHRFLADPMQFEKSIHEAWRSGRYFPFTHRVRDFLGYTTSNSRSRIVSTRQLEPGDHFRLSSQPRGGKPYHFYGRLLSTERDGFTIEVTQGGQKQIRALESDTDLFFLRENDLEYRFPLEILRSDPAREQLVLRHQLVAGGQRPRSIRLPLVRPMEFGVRTIAAESPPAGTTSREAGNMLSDPEGLSAARKVNGVLLEVSEGGFSLVQNQPASTGVYYSFEMNLPRGRVLPILGRVIESRPFGGKSHVVRCEARGMSRERRNLLDRVLKLEQQRRLRLEREKKKNRDQPTDPQNEPPAP